MAQANDCKTKWSVLSPSGLPIYCTFDHLTGRFDMQPNDFDPITGEEPRDEHWREATLICEELEGNYFYLRDVRDAFREAGLSTVTMPSY